MKAAAATTIHTHTLTHTHTCCTLLIDSSWFHLVFLLIFNLRLDFFHKVILASFFVLSFIMQSGFCPPSTKGSSWEPVVISYLCPSVEMNGIVQKSVNLFKSLDLVWCSHLWFLDLEQCLVVLCIHSNVYWKNEWVFTGNVHHPKMKTFSLKTLALIFCSLSTNETSIFPSLPDSNTWNHF